MNPHVRLEPRQPPNATPVFITVRETAEFLRLSEITLGRWRTEGVGPPYHKFGRRVVYGRSDLIAWSQAQKRSSTSQCDRRMTMWARVRLATALDFLGRHAEAMEETRQALASKGSSTATDLAEERLAAGRVDPSVLSLSELEEMARILKETEYGSRGRPSPARRKTFRAVARTSGSKAKRFTSIALDLAEARLRRGDPEGAAASASRASPRRSATFRRKKERGSCGCARARRAARAAGRGARRIENGASESGLRDARRNRRGSETHRSRGARAHVRRDRAFLDLGARSRRTHARGRMDVRRPRDARSASRSTA